MKKWLKNNYFPILMMLLNTVVWVITVLMICETINSPNWITISMEVISTIGSMILITWFGIYWYYYEDNKNKNN